MYLYHSSTRDDLEAAAQADCVAGASAATEPHLCFATEALAGLGEWLYTIDIPESALAGREVDNPFRGKDVKHFALPLDLVRRYAPRREPYLRAIGRPWNQWIESVLDRRRQSGQRQRSAWALVWMSRRGAADARVLVQREQHDETVLRTIKITTTRDFDPERDAIVVERHEELTSHAGAAPRRRWYLQTIAGPTPSWVTSPAAWKAWVWNDAVQESAKAYLLTVVGSQKVRDLVEHAAGLTLRDQMITAWRRVADEVGRVLSRLTGTPIDLGSLIAASETAALALPLRIAWKVAQITDVPWEPPVPRPEYQAPRDSGRVLLANPLGPHPTYGPGVTFATEDDAYGRRGENDLGQFPFDLGANSPASPALAYEHVARAVAVTHGRRGGYHAHIAL